MAIDLNSRLTFKSAFKFPLQNKLAREEVLWGGVLLLIPVIGWILNMGHRIQFVHHMQNGRPPWPAWGDYRQLFFNGFIAFLGMVYYYLPGIAVSLAGWYADHRIVLGIGIFLMILATVAIPGYMTHYCLNFDAREIFNPLRSLRRIVQGGGLYWKAWGIALTALVLSFSGLLVFGVGFLLTSVWFWQVAGYSFANVFTRRYALGHPDGENPGA